MSIHRGHLAAWGVPCFGKKDPVSRLLQARRSRNLIYDGYDFRSRDASPNLRSDHEMNL